jgi:ceramide glucosyltransferase
MRVRLVDGPFGQPLGLRTLKEVWRRQVRWARLRRVTFKSLFALEILSTSLPLLVAAATFRFPGFSPERRRHPLVRAKRCLLMWGWHLRSARFLWFARDLALLLWLEGWRRNDFPARKCNDGGRECRNV